MLDDLSEEDVVFTKSQDYIYPETFYQAVLRVYDERQIKIYTNAFFEYGAIHEENMND